MNLGQFLLNQSVVFPANTHNKNAVATDATGNPTFRVYEMNTETPVITGTMSKLDDANTTGFYVGTFFTAGSSGFEENKTYIIYLSATVSGVAGTASHTFQIVEEKAKENTLASVGTDVDSTLEIVGSLGSGTGAALNFDAEDDNTDAPIKGITFVGTQINVFGNTSAEDGVRHQIADVGNSLDIVYQFDIGAGRNAAKVTFKGYVAGVGDAVTVQAYNGSTWNTRATISGQTGTTNVTRDITLLASHTGTGADAGKVYIRFVSANDTVLHVDELLVSGVSVGLTTGYADGAVWVKATGNSGTTPYINGTADNPCPWADALVIANSIGLSRFRIENGETVTLLASCENKTLIGQNWILELGGQSISGSYIEGAYVSGIGTGANTPMFIDCYIGNVTLGTSSFGRCGIGYNSGTFVAGSAGQFVFADCFSMVPGSGTPVFVFSGLGSSTGINIRRWSGGTNITIDNNCTITVEVVTGGGQTIVTGGGNAEIRGVFREAIVTSSGTSLTRIVGVTGNVTVNGTGGTVRVYGVSAVVTDNTGGLVTIDNQSVSQNTITVDLSSIIGGDGDTLESISDQIDVIPTTLVDITSIETVTNKLDTMLETSGSGYKYTQDALQEVAVDVSDLALESTSQGIQAVIDKINTMLEADGLNWKLTLASLANAPNPDLSSVIGGDGDTLETISDQLDLVATPGSQMDLVPDLRSAVSSGSSGLTLQEVEGSAILAKTGDQMDLLPATLASVIDAMPSGITLGEIEGSTILAKEETSQSILSALDSLDVSSSVLAAVVEGTLTIQDVLKVLLAVLAGISTGSGQEEVNFRNQADTINRITFTLDRRGNRTGVSVNVS